MKQHNYKLKLKWTGNRGNGTTGYSSYERSHEIEAEGKAQKILLSADPAFLGNSGLFNPEELLLASLSSCHMLWYLHLCADEGIIVTSYSDSPAAVLIEGKDVNGKITGATLSPFVIIRAGEIERAIQLHAKAHKECFIANSCNFTVTVNAVVETEQ